MSKALQPAKAFVLTANSDGLISEMSTAIDALRDACSKSMRERPWIIFGLMLYACWNDFEDFIDESIPALKPSWDAENMPLCGPIAKSCFLSRSSLNC